MGKVYLVGAGPGAADLITVRGAAILARADVVFHDALVTDGIWRHCRPETPRVDVGTRGGRPSAGRQEEIHRLLAEAADRHAVVVRLKGGDPFVFGRGGEEVAFLERRGIPWEAVPGITAGIGGLGLLGLPVTHRNLASSVVLATASEAETGDLADLPWEALAAGRTTLVVYQGVGKLDALARRLVARGIDPETPAAVAARLSWPDERVVMAPLSGIAARAREAGIGAPAVLVAGHVVGLWALLGYRRAEGAGGESGVLPEISRFSGAAPGGPDEAGLQFTTGREP